MARHNTGAVWRRVGLALGNDAARPHSRSGGIGNELCPAENVGAVPQQSGDGAPHKYRRRRTEARDALAGQGLPIGEILDSVRPNADRRRDAD